MILGMAVAEMAIKREVEAAERDAARYRWLRDPANASDPFWQKVYFDQPECSGEDFDRLLDEAMRVRAAR